MVQSHPVPTVCTAKQLTGFFVGSIDNHIQLMLNVPDYLDFCMLFVITTVTQNRNGAEEVLKMFGFEKNVTYFKDRNSKQREKDSEGLTMWTIAPEDFYLNKKKIREDIDKKISKFLKVLDVPKKDRTQYPLFSISNLRKLRRTDEKLQKVTSSLSVDELMLTDSILSIKKTFIKKDPFVNVIKDIYGFDVLSKVNGKSLNVSDFKFLQNNWVKGTLTKRNLTDVIMDSKPL